MKHMNRTLLGALLSCCVAGPFALAGWESFDSGSGPGQRLILTNGMSFDTGGPVQREDALIVFRLNDGRLASLPQDQVRKVVPIPRTPTVTRGAAPAPGPQRSSGAVSLVELSNSLRGARSNAPSFSNEDLPERSAGNTELPDAGQEAVSPSAYTLPSASPDPGSLAPDPGADAGSAGSLRSSLAAAEKERDKWIRLLTCAQNGVALQSEQCTPDLQPKPSAKPSQLEQSLAASLSQSEANVDRLKAELEHAEGQRPE